MKPNTSLLTIILVLWAVSITYAQQKENRSVSDFHGIATDGLVQVHLQQGDKESVRLEVKGIGLRDIITRVEDGILIIKTEGNYNGEDIQVYVTYRNINSISVGGASKLYGKSVVKAKELSVSTSGAGDAFLTVEVDSLLISMEGAGNLTISGKTKSEKIDIKGRLNGTLDKTGLTIAK